MPDWLQVGRASIAIMNIGNIRLPLLPSLVGPDGAVPPPCIREALRDQEVVPMQDVVIRTAAGVTLVDAGRYDIPAESPYHLARYTPPPSLAEQLASLGIGLDDVAHVVITHRHFDHITGTTRERFGWVQPTFPRATYHLGAAEWPEVSARIVDAATLEARTLGVLHRTGRLSLVEHEREVLPGVSIIPAPGETAGHQVVRLHSRHETFYAVGDMFHHPVEVEAPAWMVRWADPHTNARSRAALVAAASQERALLMASHNRGLGRIVADEGGYRWIEHG